MRRPTSERRLVTADVVQQSGASYLSVLTRRAGGRLLP